MPPRLESAPKRAAKRRRPPARPSPVFAPLGRADAPLQVAQHVARRRVERAQQRLPARPLPALPTLRHPTHRQAQTAVQLTTGALQRQGGDARRDVLEDPRSRARLRPAQQAVAKLQTDARVRQGMAALHARPDVFGMPRDEVRTLHRLAVAGALPHATRRELAKLGASLEHPVRAKAGRGDRRVGLGPAVVNVDALRRTALAATSIDTAPLGPRRYAHNIAGDVKALVTAPFVGGYEALASGVELAQGHPQRAQQLAKGVAQGIAESVPVQLLRGHPGAAAEQFVEHPLLSALDVSAAGAVVGRTAGALARGAGTSAARGGVRGALARAGSTVRSPLALSEDAAAGGLVQRTYSKDLIRKAAQSLADDRREPLRDAQGRVVTVTDRGREVPVLKATPRERERHGRREANFLSSRANSVERMVREQTGRQGRVRGVRGKPAREIVSMAVEGTITSARNLQRDLRRHRDRLDAEYAQRIESGGYRHKAEAQANRDRVALVDRVLSSPRAVRQAERIAGQAVEHARRLNATEAQEIRQGLLNPRAAARSRLIPAAIEHMGARHFTVAEHGRLERAALARERELRDALEQAPADQRAGIREALQEARAERRAISGRDPRGVLKFERAQAGSRAAARQHETARAELARLTAKRQRMTGAQQVQRGGEAARRMEIASRGGRRAENVLRYIDDVLGEPRVLAKGAAAEGRRTHALDRLNRELKTARLAERAARERRTIAERRARETSLPKIQAGVRAGERTPGKRAGEFLPNAEIEAFLRAEGRDPATVAYLPHRLDVRGTRAFHAQFRPGSRPVLDKETRTGEAYRKGATEASAELLREHGVRQAVQLNKAEHLDRLVAEHGMRHPAFAKAQRGERLTKAEARIVRAGGYFTPREAREVAERLERDTGERLVPVRAFAVKLDAETRRMIREELQGPAGMDSLGLRLLNDRIVSAEDVGRARNVVLMPAPLVEQLERHLRPAGSLQRFLQWINRPFRFAVLPQTRWLTGQAVEPYIVRLTTVGSGINVFGLGIDIAAGARIVRRMERSGDPALQRAAAELRAHQLGGLFIGGRGAGVRRTAEDLPGPLKWGAVVRELPVIREGFDLLRMLPDAFFRMNRIIESGAQRAALGKSVRRDVQAFTGSWLKTLHVQQKALDEAARGLTDTATQRRFAEMQHELLGQYEGYPPWLRELIQGPMPFLPWTLSSARFSLWTLPAHRTIQTALLVKAQDVVAKDWEQIHKNTPPGGLRLAVPTKNGGWVDLARFTPMGLLGPAVEGDLQGVTDQLLPQLSGAVSAIEGRDPFGRPLRVAPTADNPQGTPNVGQKLGIAGYGLAESLVPYVSTVRRLREHGETGYAGSTVVAPRTKPGTGHGMSALERTFSPVRPVYVGRAGSTGAAPVARGPVSPRERLLERAAQRQANGGLDDRQLELLERAALRAAGG